MSKSMSARATAGNVVDLVGSAARSHYVLGKGLELAWTYGLPYPRRRVLTRFPDGRRMYLDLTDWTQRVMYCGTFEPSETRLLKQLLSPGDAFVDVGAHVGWFSTLACQLVGRNGRVLAFEAYPPNYRTLVSTAHVNAAEQLRPTLIAVEDRCGRAVVGRQSGSDSGSVTAGPGAAEGIVEVDAERLDVLVPVDLDIALLKLDVEGREAAALAGALETLKHTAAVLVELNDGALRRNGSCASEVRDTLRGAGFRRQRVLTGIAGRLGLAQTYVNLLAQR